MKLFKEDNYQITISEEAYALKAFRDLFKRDKDRSKQNAINELAYVYFFSDPRSDFYYLVNEEDRSSEVIAAIGFDKKWKPDNKVKEAVELYKKMTITESSLLLDDVLISVEKAREFIRNINFNEKDDKNKFVNPLPQYISIMNKIQDLAITIQKTKQSIEKEILENEKIRGAKSKKILDDGLDNFLN